MEKVVIKVRLMHLRIAAAIFSVGGPPSENDREDDAQAASTRLIFRFSMSMRPMPRS
jgi:hypothetical protein